VKREKGLLLPEYRLPTEAEWEYAALGLNEAREYNNYRGKKNTHGQALRPDHQNEKMKEIS